MISRMLYNLKNTYVSCTLTPSNTQMTSVANKHTEGSNRKYGNGECKVVKYIVAFFSFFSLNKRFVQSDRSRLLLARFLSSNDSSSLLLLLLPQLTFSLQGI